MTEKNHLENSMIQEITIPMSINDFARRERFKVGFGLIIDTVARIHARVARTSHNTWEDLSNDDYKGLQLQLEAYVTTLNSIIAKINDDSE